MPSSASKPNRDKLPVTVIPGSSDDCLGSNTTRFVDRVTFEIPDGWGVGSDSADGYQVEVDSGVSREKRLRTSEQLDASIEVAAKKCSQALLMQLTPALGQWAAERSEWEPTGERFLRLKC